MLIWLTYRSGSHSDAHESSKSREAGCPRRKIWNHKRRPACRFGRGRTVGRLPALLRLQGVHEAQRAAGQRAGEHTNYNSLVFSATFINHPSSVRASCRSNTRQCMTIYPTSAARSWPSSSGGATLSLRGSNLGKKLKVAKLSNHLYLA